MRSFAYFPQDLFCDVGPENRRFSWGKKSSEGSATMPIWEFTGRSPETGHFPPFFGVFDPLDFEMDAKNARETRIFSIVRLSLKNAFFKFGFLARSVLAASDRKIADSAGGNRVRRVRPDRLISKNRSFIWKFTGQSPKNWIFPPVFGVC